MHGQKNIKFSTECLVTWTGKTTEEISGTFSSRRLKRNGKLIWITSECH